MEQVHYKSQLIKIISYTGKVLAGQGTLMSLVTFARDARESSIIFRANERIYTHTVGAGCHCLHLMRLQFAIRCCLLAIVSVAFAPLAYPTRTRYPPSACACKFALELIKIALVVVALPLTLNFNHSKCKLSSRRFPISVVSRQNLLDENVILYLENWKWMFGIR